LKIKKEESELIYQNSLEFTQAIVIRQASGQYYHKHQVTKFISEVDGLKDNHPYLFDKKGRPNLREMGDNQHILLFKKDCEIQAIKEKIEESYERLKKQNKWPKYHITIFKGNPLDSQHHITVKVINPLPNSKKEDYMGLGELESWEKINGEDQLHFKTISPILTAMEQYYKIKKEKKGKKAIPFFLDPIQKNKAAPQYKITTKNFNVPPQTKDLLNVILENFPIQPKAGNKTEKETPKEKETEKESEKIFLGSHTFEEETEEEDPKTPKSLKKRPRRKNYADMVYGDLEDMGSPGKSPGEEQIGKLTCAGKKKKKGKCNAPRQKGSEYCQHHQDQDPKKKSND
jgi:hypothetical protein